MIAIRQRYALVALFRRRKSDNPYKAFDVYDSVFQYRAVGSSTVLDPADLENGDVVRIHFNIARVGLYSKHWSITLRLLSITRYMTRV